MQGEDKQARQKRLLVVMDISGVGRCSALVVVPVLSLSGSSVAFLPTAYFSAHTGGFGAVHRHDMSHDMEEALKHYRALGLRFDAVYVGYCANPKQLRLLEDALPHILMDGGKLYVDPVMGDHGRRYTFCGEELLQGFARLCKHADLIFPNRTEAALLLGLPLEAGVEPPVPACDQLLGLGAKNVIVTGVDEGSERIGVLALTGDGRAFTCFRKRYEGSYPGTGDLLASSVIAALTRGASLETACGLACDFLDEALQQTKVYDAPPRFGLAFETALPGLTRNLASIF